MLRFVNDLGRELTEEEMKFLKECVKEAKEIGEEFWDTMKLSQVITNCMSGLWIFSPFDTSKLKIDDRMIQLVQIIYNGDLQTTKKLLGYSELKMEIVARMLELVLAETKNQKIEQKNKISELEEEIKQLRLEIDFAPGGVGMLKAEKEFNGVCGKKIKKRRNSL